MQREFGAWRLAATPISPSPISVHLCSEVDTPVVYAPRCIFVPSVANNRSVRRPTAPAGRRQQSRRPRSVRPVFLSYVFSKLRSRCLRGRRRARPGGLYRLGSVAPLGLVARQCASPPTHFQCDPSSSAAWPSHAASRRRQPPRSAATTPNCPHRNEPESESPKPQRQPTATERKRFANPRLFHLPQSQRPDTPWPWMDIVPSR